MEMYFSAETIETIMTEYHSVFLKRNELRESYLTRAYQSPRANEFASHGFSRRLGTLTRCIEKVFEILPPNRVELPTKDELRDAEINIQAFVIGIFGITDNLAWIWVSERDVRKSDGTPIMDQWVGLRSINTFVRQTFSDQFQAYLVSLDAWFENLENYRHALAHRIPLYIPPYSVTVSKLAEYNEFERQKIEALNRHDFAEHARLSDEQMALCEFRPLMTHSFGENADPIVFHAQLLADYNTVVELGQKMLIELNS